MTVDLLAELLGEAPPPANPANPANYRASRDAQPLANACESAANFSAEARAGTAKTAQNPRHDRSGAGRSGGDDPPERPYKLSPAELGRAHAWPWTDAAIARFQTRAGRFIALGYSGQDAEDLAERLTLRDVEEDARGCCLECLALSGYRGNGFRCSVPDRAGLTGGRERSALGADFVVMLQHCPGLRTRGQQ
jgi:hypothetical protein